ncbi:MAG: anti-sigma factor [Rufibacter sp.]
MNTQEYIDSGILELYAAGGLTLAEQAEVDRMAAQYAEVRQALEQAIHAMEAYALTHAQAPRPELEDKILGHIQNLEKPSVPGGVAHETEGARVIPMASARPNAGKSQWLNIAATVLLLVSIGTNIFLYRNLHETRQELVATQSAARQYALQVNQVEQLAFRNENLLAVLRDPQTKAIYLKGVEKHPEALASVYWNQETKEVFFDPSRLPAAPAGKQYQLWALAAGKPVNAGVVAPSDSPLQRMSTIAEAQAFAVTLEPEGGSVNPTLDEMVVMGAI